MKDYEVGDRLLWTDTVGLGDDGEDYPMDAPERQAVIEKVEGTTVQVRFGDDLVELYTFGEAMENFERQA